MARKKVQKYLTFQDKEAELEKLAESGLSGYTKTGVDGKEYAWNPKSGEWQPIQGQDAQKIIKQSRKKAAQGGG